MHRTALLRRVGTASYSSLRAISSESHGSGDDSEQPVRSMTVSRSGQDPSVAELERRT
jgi:hypothetical protein